MQTVTKTWIFNADAEGWQIIETSGTWTNKGYHSGNKELFVDHQNDGTVIGYAYITKTFEELGVPVLNDITRLKGSFYRSVTLGANGQHAKTSMDADAVNLISIETRTSNIASSERAGNWVNFPAKSSDLVTVKIPLETADTGAGAPAGRTVRVGIQSIILEIEYELPEEYDVYIADAERIIKHDDLYNADSLREIVYADHVEVQRKIGAGEWEMLARVPEPDPENPADYFDEGPFIDLEEYYYRVRYYSGQYGPWSNIETVIYEEIEDLEDIYIADAARSIMRDEFYNADKLRKPVVGYHYSGDTKRKILIDQDYRGDMVRRTLASQFYPGDILRKTLKEFTYSADLLREIIVIAEEYFIADMVRQLLIDQVYSGDSERKILKTYFYPGDSKRKIIKAQEYPGDSERKILLTQKYFGDMIRKILTEKYYQADLIRGIKREYKYFADLLREIIVIAEEYFIADMVRQLLIDQAYPGDSKRKILEVQKYPGDSERKTLKAYFYPGDSKRKIIKAQEYPGDSLRKTLKEFTYSADMLREVIFLVEEYFIADMARQVIGLELEGIQIDDFLRLIWRYTDGSD